MNSSKRIYAKRTINLRVEGTDPPEAPAGFIRSETCDGNWSFRYVLSYKFGIIFGAKDRIILVPGVEEKAQGEDWEAKLSDKVRTKINMRKFGGSDDTYSIKLIDRRTMSQKKPPAPMRPRGFRLR